MRFFNDVFDTGVRDERALKIVNFFVMAHLFLFMLLFCYVIYMGCVKGQAGVFEDEVGKLKARADAADTKK